MGMEAVRVSFNSDDIHFPGAVCRNSGTVAAGGVRGGSDRKETAVSGTGADRRCTGKDDQLRA